LGGENLWADTDDTVNHGDQHIAFSILEILNILCQQKANTIKTLLVAGKLGKLPPPI